MGCATVTGVVGSFYRDKPILNISQNSFSINNAISFSYLQLLLSVVLILQPCFPYFNTLIIDIIPSKHNEWTSCFSICKS